MLNINLLLIFLYLFFSTILIYFLPERNRWKGLLITSLLFYYFLLDTKIIILLLLSFIIYKFSHSNVNRLYQKGLIIFAILIPLIISKITSNNFHFGNYFLETNNIEKFNNFTDLLSIVGISYFTFNAISYIIDIRRKYIVPEKNYFKLLLYLIYFPCIFSGPLHRAKYLFQQFQKIEVTNQNISKGMRLILWGIFKNLVIGERIYLIIQQYLNTEISGIYYLLIGLLFFFYLYCNFSSFVDFFQGVSKIFGIELKSNFKNRVYFSPSRQEFWKGWHITLNEWFRDYFFFPLAKKDRKRKYTDFILLITFLCIAIWHELTPIFLLWGVLNGLWIIIEKKINLEKMPFPKLRRFFGPVYHLTISCLLALIFISPNLPILVKKVFIEPSYFPLEESKVYINTIIITIVSFIIMDYHYIKAGNNRFDNYLESKSIYARWFIYTKLTFIIIVFSIDAGIDNYYIQF